MFVLHKSCLCRHHTDHRYGGSAIAIHPDDTAVDSKHDGHKAHVQWQYRSSSDTLAGQI